MAVVPTTSVQWLPGGRQFFPAMLETIRQARASIELETYIFADDVTGRQMRDALIEAARSGVRVRLLVDAFGSLELSDFFFAPLTTAGGAVQFFNPLRFSRFGVRDHRKLLVCDNREIFIGGANISDNYNGDGVTQGWFDLMVRMENPELAVRLREEFDQLFTNAEFALRRHRKFRAFRQLRRPPDDGPRLFPVRPGHGAGAFQRALQHALARASSVDFILPYFLPNHRLRKRLWQIVRRGGRVRLILPALCDVPLARAAGMVFYSRLLRGGVEIYEYQPQILHGKLYIVDDKVFAGSANLDVRSAKLNYELMVQFSGF
jgi:cardiolipin synthase